MRALAFLLVQKEFWDGVNPEKIRMERSVNEINVTYLEMI